MRGRESGSFSEIGENQKTALTVGISGAGSGNRTRTSVKKPDFESGASTSSATPAQKAGDYSRAFLGLSALKTGYLVVILAIHRG